MSPHRTKPAPITGKRAFSRVKVFKKLKKRLGKRAGFGTFEDYCRERWGFSRQRAFQFIESAEVVSNLKMSTIVDIPKTESQTRPLTTLPEPEQRVEAWTNLRPIGLRTPSGKRGLSHSLNEGVPPLHHRAGISSQRNQHSESESPDAVPHR